MAGKLHTASCTERYTSSFRGAGAPSGLPPPPDPSRPMPDPMNPPGAARARFPVRSRLRAWGIAAASALAAATVGAATPGVDAPPEPGPSLAVQVPALQDFTLANGLRVVLAPRPQVPLVTVQVLVLTGSEAEPEGRAGLAGLVGGLLTKGARRGGQAVDAAALVRQAEALGGTLDTSTGVRSTTVGMTVTTPRLPQALALLADVTRQPLLAAEELDRLRAQSVDGLRVALDSPGSVAEMVARRSWWGAGVYGRVPTPASLQRVSIEDVRRFHATHWRPDRTVLVLAGDVGADTARALAQKTLGDWIRPDTPPVVSRGAAPAPTLPSRLWIDLPGSGQSAVLVSVPTRPAGSAGDAAEAAAAARVADVAHTVLGGGYSSRLNQVIRIERGLSYGAFGGAEVHPLGGVWTGQAQTRHTSAAEVAQIMRQQILRLATEPVPEKELEARKAVLIGGLAGRLQTTAGLAGLLVSQVAQGRDPAELQHRVAQIQAVTPAQVQAHAARYWTPAALRVVVAGDWQAAGEGGRALGDGTDASDVSDAVRRWPGNRLDFDHPALGTRTADGS